MFVSETIGSRVVKQVADELGLPLELVNKVHQYQWESTYKALKIGTSIEVTDLFRLIIKPNIVDKNLEKKKQLLEFFKAKETSVKNDKYINSLQQDIDYLNSKKK